MDWRRVWLLTEGQELARFLGQVLRASNNDFLCGLGVSGPIYAQARQVSRGVYDIVSPGDTRLNDIIISKGQW